MLLWRRLFPPIDAAPLCLIRFYSVTCSVRAGFVPLSSDTLSVGSWFCTVGGVYPRSQSELTPQQERATFIATRSGEHRLVPDGFGELAGLVAEPSATDVFVNGAGPVWVDRGSGLIRADGLSFTEPRLRQLATRLISLGGRRIDEASRALTSGSVGSSSWSAFAPS